MFSGFLVRLANCDDSIPLDGKIAGVRQGGIDRIDYAIQEYQVGRRNAPPAATEKKQRKDP
jgi:hypothetical protein